MVSSGLRIGLVGTGKRGLVYSQVLQAEPEACLVVVHDLDPARARLVASRHGSPVHVAEDFDDLLSRCDAVVIATPDNSHSRLTIAALSAGCPVLCDKPVGIGMEELNEVASALTAHRSTPFTVAMVLRYHPFYRALRKTLQEHGRVSQVQVNELMNGQFYFRRWHRFRSFSGGILLHEGIHSLDMLAWLLDDHPDRVVGFSSSHVLRPTPNAAALCRDCALAAGCEHYFDVQADPWYDIYQTPRQQEGEPRDLCVFNSAREVDESHNVVFGYGDGLLVSYSLTLVAPVRTRRYSFVCDGAVVYGDETAATISVSTRGGQSIHLVQVPDVEYGGGDRLHMRDFVCIARSGERHDSVLAQNLGATATALAAELAARNGSPIKVEGSLEGGYRLWS